MIQAHSVEYQLVRLPERIAFYAHSSIYAGGLIAFKNYLASARLEGKPSEAIWLPARPVEIVGGSNVACTLEDASQSPGDILFLSRLLIEGTSRCKGD